MKPALQSTRLVLRTPLLPFTDWLTWSGNTAERQAVRDRLEALLARPEVEEALFIASPSTLPTTYSAKRSLPWFPRH